MTTTNKILGGLLIVALIYIAFIQGCGSGKGPAETGFRVDTVNIETIVEVHHYDTAYKELIVKIPNRIRDTSTYYDTIAIPYYSDSDFEEMMRYPAMYHDTIKDSLVSIYFTALVRGYLDDMKMGYRILAPRKTVITNITTEVAEKKKFNGLYFGVNIGSPIDTLKFTAFTPMLELSFEKTNFEAGYNFIDKSVIFGIRTRIGKKRNINLVGIKN